MNTEQREFEQKTGWNLVSDSKIKGKAQFVIAFGATSLIKDKKRFGEIKSFYPDARILICSTAGEILDTKVSDDTIALTAVSFEDTKLTFAETGISGPENSFDAGKILAESIEKKDLVHLMVFSDGLKVNGTGLVEGLKKIIGADVSITGGLVGDGANFK